MLISDKHKFIFIHNPKAAGSSVFETLKPYANVMCRHNIRQLNYYLHKFFGNVYSLCNYGMHISAAELRRDIPKRKWDRFFKFGIVRNPYDRAASFFFYLRARPDSDKYEEFKSLGTFKNYILKLRNEHWKETQQYYFTDEHGGLLVDRIIKFENLQEEFAGVMQSLNLPRVALPVVNARKTKKKYLEHLDNEVLEIMNELYDEDFRLFGYEKIESL
jgi:hypothetical protein